MKQIILILTKFLPMTRIIALLIFLVCHGFSYSQSYDRSYLRNDILVSYGIPSTDMFISVQSSTLDDYFPDGRYLRDNYSGTGVIGITYRRVSHNEMFLWGVSLSYNSTKGEMYYLGSYEGELVRTFYNMAFEGQYRYQNLNKVQLYSGVSVGYSLGKEELLPPEDSGKSKVNGDISRIAYQINAIGIRFGDQIGGYLELGYGYKGIINAGISFQLL